MLKVDNFHAIHSPEGKMDQMTETTGNIAFNFVPDTCGLIITIKTGERVNSIEVPAPIVRELGMYIVSELKKVVFRNQPIDKSKIN
jgi:hypothetical protein